MGTRKSAVAVFLLLADRRFEGLIDAPPVSYELEGSTGARAC